MDAPAQTTESVAAETVIEIETATGETAKATRSTPESAEQTREARAVKARAVKAQTAKPARKPRKKASAATPPEPVERAEESSEPSQPAADAVRQKEPTAGEEAPQSSAPAADAADVVRQEEPTAGEEAPASPEQAEVDAPQGEPPEHTIESVRAHETPIFAAMFSGWKGPAVGMISRNLHRADDDTMVFDMLMWRPGPDEAAPTLRFHVSGDRHAPVITVDGELDSGSVALLTTPLRHILRRRPRQLIVDLAGICAASPAALRALLDVRGAARAAHVDFWLRSPSEPVRELLQPANSQVALRPKSSAARRSPGPIEKRDQRDGEAIGVDDGEDSDAEPSSQTATRLKARPVAARFSVIHRRPSAESTVLEGVVVQGPVTRSKPWWSSRSLRESLRRVGMHQHAHGHGSPT
jgi:anti-anti-sigma factor